MRILNVETKEALLEIKEIELSHFGLTDLSGTEKKIEELKSLIEIKLKGEPILMLREDNNKITFIRSEHAFKMIIETLYNHYQNDPNMKVRFE